MKKLLLNENFIIVIILLNTIIIFCQEMGCHFVWLNIADALCTIIFVMEMIIKQSVFGIKGYWSQGWNRFDGCLVLISIPSLVSYIFPELIMPHTNFVLVLRVFRVFRFFRVFHLFPNFGTIVKNVHTAVRHSFSIFVGFGILMLVFALISCAIFHKTIPDYFSNPIESLYAIFRICTIEGWYDIPAAIVEGSMWSPHFVRIYFIVILVSMGIIGTSIINSIFVDAMVSDNNDEIVSKLEELENKIENINKKL